MVEKIFVIVFKHPPPIVEQDSNIKFSIPPAIIEQLAKTQFPAPPPIVEVCPVIQLDTPPAIFELLIDPDIILFAPPLIEFLSQALIILQRPKITLA